MRKVVAERIDRRDKISLAQRVFAKAQCLSEMHLLGEGKASVLEMLSMEEVLVECFGQAFFQEEMAFQQDMDDLVDATHFSAEPFDGRKKALVHGQQSFAVGVVERRESVPR